MVEALEEDVTLEELDLNGSSIGVAGVERLAATIAQSDCELRDLDLTGNSIGNDGVATLAQALSAGASLESLILRSNNITEEGACHLVAALKLHEVALKELSLARNHIGDAGAIALAGSMKHSDTRLQELDLTSTRVKTEGGVALAKSLCKNNSLQVLRLRDNELGDNVAVELAASLVSTSALREVDLRRTGLEDQGVLSIAAAISEQSQLSTLDLTGCFAWVLTILLAALRILVVDEHFWNESRSYGVFPVPSACPNSSRANSTESWIGLDGLEYCSDEGNFSEVAFSEGTPYYIATAKTSYDQSCSFFTIGSAVLDLWDCEERLGGVACAAINPLGIEECTRLSWVLGWKLGVLLDWVLILKVLTDFLLLLALLTASSKKSATIWTIVLVSFELYQLAILLPATVFFHGECLHITSPSYVSLHTIQDGVLALAAATHELLLLLMCIIGPFILCLGLCLGLFFAIGFLFGLLTAVEELASYFGCCHNKKVESAFCGCLGALVNMGSRMAIAYVICTLVPWIVGVILVLAAAIPFCCIALFLLFVPGRSEAGLIGLVLASNLMVKYPLTGAAVLLWNYAPEDWTWKGLKGIPTPFLGVPFGPFRSRRGICKWFQVSRSNYMRTGLTEPEGQSLPAPVQIGLQEST